MNDIVYTIPEVADYLKISKSKIYYLAKRGEIPSFRIGRNIRILESELVIWLQRQRAKEPSQLMFVIDNALSIGK